LKSLSPRKQELERKKEKQIIEKQESIELSYIRKEIKEYEIFSNQKKI